VPKAKPMISIVDDDESMREAVKGLTKSWGYTAEAFASAEEFLSSRLVLRTSCLIVDVMMPWDDRDRAASPLGRFGKDHPYHPDHGSPLRRCARARLAGWDQGLP
jgi:FixJ family two-component response regulator